MIDVAQLMGERFQNIDGRQLLLLTREDFIALDTLYGELLYDTFYQLLKQCCFVPPEDHLSVDSDHYTEKRPSNAAGILLPKPVEDLMMHPDEDDSLLANNGSTKPWIRYHSDNNSATLLPAGVVRIYGHTYDIDCAADFHCVAQPAVGLLVNTAERTRHVEYESSETIHTPIDLSTSRSPSTATREADSWTTQPDCPPSVVNPPSTVDDSALMPQQTIVSEESKKSRVLGKRPTSKKAAPSGKVRREDTSHDDVDDPSGVNGGGRHLWEFIRDLLSAGDRQNGGLGTVVIHGENDYEEKTHCVPIESIIRWENRNDGVFRIIDSKKVAQLWGRRKHNSTMTYEKLSRALRWCRKNRFFAALPKDCGYPKKLCFKFGPLAKKWKTS